MTTRKKQPATAFTRGNDPYADMFMHFRLQEEDREWMREGACRHRQDLDFFPENPRHPDVAEVVAVCNACVVSDKCLQYALKNGEMYGVWGGLLPHERNGSAYRKRTVHVSTVVE
jgi:WhiB family redox-sensing transcriptional regulator